MYFFLRVAGLSLRVRMRSLDIWEEFGIEPLLLHIERSQLRGFQHLVWDAPWTSLWGGVLGMPIWEETPGQTKDTLKRLYLSAGQGTFQCPPGGFD